MTPQERFIARYGDPSKDKATFEREWMCVLTYPQDIRDKIPSLGKSLYCNKDFVEKYLRFLRLLIQRGLHKEINSNDECFNVRFIRGTTDKLSTHSWAMAVDFNPKDNPLGESRLDSIKAGRTPFTEQFQQAARDAGFTAGIDFKRKDGMHLELPCP